MIPWWNNSLTHYAKGLEASIEQKHVSMGEVTTAFESHLSNYFFGSDVTCVPSGTAAITASLLSLGATASSTILLPNRTWIGTANAANIIGSDLVLLDSLPDHQNVSPSHLEFVVRTHLSNDLYLVWVPINGSFKEYINILQIVKKYKIKLIVDAAQSFGSNLQALREFLAHGAVITFSFGMPKIISTGLGGCVVSRSKEFCANLRTLRNQGICLNKGLAFSQGFNFKFTDMQAFLGIGQINNIDIILDLHLRVINEYNIAFKGLPFSMQGNYCTTNEIPLRYEISVDNAPSFHSYMQDLGIEVSLRTDNITTHPLYSSLKSSKLKNSLLFENSIVVLPSGPSQDLSTIKHVSNSVINFYRESV